MEKPAYWIQILFMPITYIYYDSKLSNTSEDIIPDS